MDSTTESQYPQGGTDPFAEAARTVPAPLPTKYVSMTSVDVGEGIQFRVRACQVVIDRFSDEDGAKVFEIDGEILKSNAARFSDGADVVITCKSRRLEQMANELAQTESGGVDVVVTLVRGEDEGKAAGWRWKFAGQPGWGERVTP